MKGSCLIRQQPAPDQVETVDFRILGYAPLRKADGRDKKHVILGLRAHRQGPQ